MTEKKTSFVLPTDLLDDLEDFSDEEVGKIFRAILIYTNEAEEPEFDDRAMKVVFRHIKKYIDSANENYDKKVQANRVNGAKGGRPKKDAEENPKNPTVIEKTERFSEKPGKSHTETESETDIETVSECECESETDIETVSECECETETDIESVSECECETEPDGVAHTHTKSYGENKNVMLSDEEYERLTERMGGSKRSEYIEKLSDYMASTGKKYQSHYATICSWFRQDGGQKPSTSFDMDEIIARDERLPVYEKKIDSS